MLAIIVVLKKYSEHRKEFPIIINLNFVKSYLQTKSI